MKNLVNLLFVLALSACSYTRLSVERESAEQKNQEILGINAQWIKDKGKKYDIRLELENKAQDDHIIVRLSDIQCWREDQRGRLTHTFFNTGERTMDFYPGELKVFNAVCRIGRDGAGTYRITIRRVFLNPSKDGVNTGKLLAENVSWEYDLK